MPVIIGAPAGFQNPQFDSELLQCSECEHMAWYSPEFKADVQAGVLGSMCGRCFMETSDGQSQITEETLQACERMGMSRHKAYTLMQYADDERFAHVDYAGGNYNMRAIICDTVFWVCGVVAVTLIISLVIWG